MHDLSGRVALVTGGGKGVGKVVARHLAERGAHVLINCFHSYAAANQTRDDLVAQGHQVDVLRASVAKQEHVTRMFAEIEERFGRLDVLVNNAADGWLGPVQDIAAEHFTKALSTNLLGSFWCARAAASLMARRGAGCIVNLSSNGAGMVPDNYLVVGTSKAALEALTRHLAAAYAPLGIRVNAASCSLVQGAVAELFPQSRQMQDVTVAHTPLGRLATADDLAGVVDFLTSDLSSWVTGQVVLADGGLSLGNAMLSPSKEAVSPAPQPPVSDALGDDLTDQADGGEAPDPEADPVVVVGMGMVAPGANNPDEYWELALRGGEQFVEVPADRWDGSAFFSTDQAAPDKTYQSRSGFLRGFVPEPELADELAEGHLSGEYGALWLRHALVQALRGVTRRPGDRTTFCVGYTADGSQHLEEALVLAGASQRLTRLADGNPAEGAAAQAAVQTLQQHLWRGLPGPAPLLPHRIGAEAMQGLLPDDTELFMLDTACSSSLYSIDVGMKSLLLGTVDVAVCGGSFALGPRGAVLFSKLHGLSTGGAVRSLDAAADGVLFSDGAGVVVLKRLSRARADGDQVLGVLAGMGSSSDGKGKAIYAPSSSGQRIAVERALAHPGVHGLAPDWVLAHATGTPAGDRAEVAALRDSLPGEGTVYLTSNKSLIGHTGWAAGVISVIEVLLALRHHTIPAQHRFQQAPPDFDLAARSLVIPLQPVPWERHPGRPRAAAVSGFGFGGTNAHLVVHEHDGHRVATPTVSPDERLAVVGWSAHVPGLADRRELEQWLAGTGRTPDASFGDRYPVPPLSEVRLPPGTVRSLDRCQLMILQSVLPLRAALGDFWTSHQDRTGVFAGHLGATRNATLYGQRCYLDELHGLLRQAHPDVWDAELGPLYERYAKEIRGLVPQSDENSFPGIMPNVIPARVANYLDLHGVNMTVDTGFSSALAAIEIAGRYLRSGDLDLAVVSGVSGNSTVEITGALAVMAGLRAEDCVVAEGAFTLAVTLESTARGAGLPVLALLDTGPAAHGTPGASGDLHPHAGQPNYAGGEGAFAVLRAVVGATGPTVVRDEVGAHVVTVHPPALTGPGATDPASEIRPAAPPEPAAPPLTVRRHVARLAPFPYERVRPPVLFVGPGTVVVTDDPDLLAAVEFPPGSLLLSTRPSRRGALPHLLHLPDPSPAAVADAFERLAEPVVHVRLLTDLSATDTYPPGGGSALDGQLALHDLLFLTAQRAYEGLRQPGSTLVVGLLGGYDATHRTLHRDAGLFTGFVKSVSVELRALLAFTMATSTHDPAVAIVQLESESAARQHLPVIARDGDRRATWFLSRADGDPVEPAVPIPPDAVVLAAGGSRGIAAELLKAVAQASRPKIVVLGTNDLTDDGATLPTRTEYVRQELLRAPGTSVADLNQRYQARVDADTARGNLAAMASHCGAGRVRYLQCDVRDQAAVARAVAGVLAEHGRIDLVVNVAGTNRAAELPRKRFEDFRAVRDLKVRSYHNLKAALGDVVPAIWCNFGSIVGFTGQAGETDYAAGNDFLTTAAQHAVQAQGRDELTLGWCLWREAGLGSDPVKRSFLARSGIYTGLTNEEGIHHFLRELERRPHEPAVMLLGESERAALEDYRPGYLAAVPGRGAPRGRFYLGATLARDQRSACHERTFDLARDDYLSEHVVQGQPTLPGTFVTEIAAEAATDLVPGRVPAVIEDLVFDTFLRVYGPDRPVRKTIQAELLAHDEQESVVRVRVLGDVVSPSGVVLVRDRLHFSAVVRMRDQLPPAPTWERWRDEEDEDPVPDPYHVPNPAAHLSGRLVSTSATRQHALGRRATYRLAARPDDPTFRQFLVPAILLDGLLRVSVLDPRPSGHILLAAPRSIRRIDFYTSGNDLAVAAEHPIVDLYSCPRRLDLEGPLVENRCVAATPDGRILAQIHDTATAIVGFVHPDGEFLTAEQMARRRLARVASS